MVAWMGIYIGMRFRRTLTALMAMLLLLVAWCIGPFVILVPIFEAVEIRPDHFAAGALIASPLTVPAVTLFGDELGSMPWLQLFVSIAFYFCCWRWFRRLSFSYLERGLGRKCEQVTVGRRRRSGHGRDVRRLSQAGSS